MRYTIEVDSDYAQTVVMLYHAMADVAGDLDHFKVGEYTIKIIDDDGQIIDLWKQEKE